MHVIQITQSKHSKLTQYTGSKKKFVTVIRLILFKIFKNFWKIRPQNRTQVPEEI